MRRIIIIIILEAASDVRFWTGFQLLFYDLTRQLIRIDDGAYNSIQRYLKRASRYLYTVQFD